MFRLTRKEWAFIKHQSVMVPDIRKNRSQIVTGSSVHRNVTAVPFAFTEHGITMLASVLRSERAVKMNIAIVRAFIALRQFALNYQELAEQNLEIKKTVKGHNQQLGLIYDAIEQMLDEKSEQRKWEDRERIGFRK